MKKPNFDQNIELDKTTRNYPDNYEQNQKQTSISYKTSVSIFYSVRLGFAVD